MVKKQTKKFNGNKKLSVYVSPGNDHGSVLNEHVEAIRYAWNKAPGFLGKCRKYTKRISIIPTVSDNKVGAYWDDSKKIMKFHINTGYEILKHNETESKTLVFKTYHEMAHAWFDREYSLESDSLLKFIYKAQKIKPFNEYLMKYESLWKDNSGYLWATELHSAVVEVVFGGNLRGVENDNENFQEALRLFNELHGETYC